MAHPTTQLPMVGRTPHGRGPCTCRDCGNHPFNAKRSKEKQDWRRDTSRWIGR